MATTSERDAGPARGEAIGAGRPISIGLYSSGWPPQRRANGLISYVAAVTEGLEALGHRVTILSPDVSGGESDPRVLRLVEEPRRSPARRLADRAWSLLAPRAYRVCRLGPGIAEAIAKGVRDRGIQILEMEEAFGWAETVSRAVPVPVSVRLHGPWFANGTALGVPDGPEFRERVAREGRAIGQAAGVTAPSRDVLERTRAHYGLALDHAEVIPNPTRHVPPQDRWKPEDREPGRILFAGRFDRHKGGDLIVEAFARVLQAVPDARLDFAGPDEGLTDDKGRPWDLASFVDARIPGAREDGRVRLLGRVLHDELPALRRRASVTVICSRYEVFGLTAAEAGAMGCPIVAARVGGIPEILRENVDALFHRPGDPIDLADRILELLSDPGRAAQLGAEAADRCNREFHPVAVATRLADHFRRLIRPAAPAGPHTPAARSTI